MATNPFPIPVFRYFVNENATNPYCGSVGLFNYRILPVKPKEENVAPYFEVYTWYGMLCSDLAPRQAEEHFPLDADGLAAAIQWLHGQLDAMPDEI